MRVEASPLNNLKQCFSVCQSDFSKMNYTSVTLTYSSVRLTENLKNNFAEAVNSKKFRS